MPSKGDFPGLQRSPPRTDGSIALHWVAPRKAIEAGYLPKTVRLHGYTDGSPELSARCHQLDAEQQAWLAEQEKPEKRFTYDGTVGSLVRLYETDECSPYMRLKRHSTKNADYELRKLKRTVAERRVEKLDGRDFWRWYSRFRQPAYEGGPERITDAYNIMTRARGVFTFGVLLRLPACAELRNILSLIRFPNPVSRKQAIKFQEVVAFIAKAHKLGYPEMALAQALEYDLTLRQGDVIGKWEYKENDRNTLEWVGLRWEEIDKDLILFHKTNKKGRDVVAGLKAYELVYAELLRFPILPSIGPMIVDSRTGRPFEYEEFRKRWRIIARAAGIRAEVQYRDSRAGGITEARNAGADKDDIRQLAGHAQVETTEIYIREHLEPSNRVAHARTAYRKQRTGHDRT
jgi:integrase